MRLRTTSSSLDNDAPVAADLSGLATDQLGPNVARKWAHAVFANWDVDVFAQVADAVYRADDSGSTYFVSNRKRLDILSMQRSLGRRGREKEK